MRPVVIFKIILASSLSTACHSGSDDVTKKNSPHGPEASDVRDDGRVGSGRPEFVKQQGAFEGMVEEVLPAGSYTYFSVRLDSGESRWAVVLGGKEQRDSDRLRFKSFGIRHNFPSPRLNREFDEIYFCSLDSTS